MRALLVSSAMVLVACTGGGTGGSGGGGGSSGGGAGGGSGGGTALDAGVNLLPAGFEAYGNRVLAMPDGGVLVVGDLFREDSGTQGDMFVAKFQTATQRDLAFGTNGVASADFDGGSLGGGLVNLDFDFGHGIALDGDKIVVVGSARGQSLGGYDFALMRLLANGQRDTTFGANGNGLVLRALNATLGVVLQHVVVQADGKYLTCGGFQGNHALERYNSDGSIDPTYSAALMNFGSDREHCGTMVMQGNKPLVGGRNFGLARYTEAGAVDTTFGTNGSYLTDGTLGAAHIRADGKLWLVGSVTKLINGQDKGFLKQVLLSADGAPDPSFGTNGVLEVEYSVSHVRGSAFHGAKLVIYIPSVPARLIRLNTDGSVDSTFGTGGSISIPFRLPLLDGTFDAHQHLTISGNTVWVTDTDLVTIRQNEIESRLGLFSAPL